MKPRVKAQDREMEELFRSKLKSIINLPHELVRLGQLVDWARLEAHFAPYYQEAGDQGYLYSIPGTRRKWNASAKVRRAPRTNLAAMFPSPPICIGRRAGTSSCRRGRCTAIRTTATHCKWLSTTSTTSSGVVRYALDHGYKGHRLTGHPHTAGYITGHKRGVTDKIKR